jgi:hypothetical protein
VPQRDSPDHRKLNYLLYIDYVRLVYELPGIFPRLERNPGLHLLLLIRSSAEYLTESKRQSARRDADNAQKNSYLTSGASALAAHRDLIRPHRRLCSAYDAGKLVHEHNHSNKQARGALQLACARASVIHVGHFPGDGRSRARAQAALLLRLNPPAPVGPTQRVTRQRRKRPEGGAILIVWFMGSSSTCAVRTSLPSKGLSTFFFDSRGFSPLGSTHATSTML